MKSNLYIVIMLIFSFSTSLFSAKAQIGESGQVSYTSYDTLFSTYGNYLVKKDSNCIFLESGIFLYLTKSIGAFKEGCIESNAGNSINIEINAFPNAFTDQFILKILRANNIDREDIVSVKIISIDGRIVLGKKTSIKELLAGVRFECGALPAGIYVAVLYSKNFSFSYKLIKGL